MKTFPSLGGCLKPLLCLALPLFGSPADAQESAMLIHAARVFDGYTMRNDASVLLANGRVSKIDNREAFKDIKASRIELADATLLPGFIELHAHLTFQKVPADTVLRHGVTTLRDVGGPLHQPYGGDGGLRVLTSGPIITAPGGYPIPGLGETDIATPVAGEEQARDTVRKLVEGGAAVVKVALEPGGEAGAPWSGGHANGLGRKVSAHLAEEKGAQIALNAGIDEWAHTPCEELPESLLQRSVAQGVNIVGTIDTLSKCPGVASNVRRLSALGAEFLYGAEIAHPDIPWGIDGQELLLLQHMAGMQPLEVLRTATSKAGLYLNMPLLGTLLPGAPADLIAVRGDPTQRLKSLEYPDLVISGGKVVIDHFGAPDRE